MLLSLNVLKQDRQLRTLQRFLRILEQLFKVISIFNSAYLLNQLISYVELNICDEWSSFKEFKASNQEQFLKRLKLKFPKLTSEKQSTMDQLRKLTYQYQEISILEENHLLAFKKCFIYVAQRCLKPPAVTENRKLVELFVKNLDTYLKFKAKSTRESESR